ncbi:gamma-glutamyltranspeptidase / glutathione hydrolase [Pseudonocardia thermophila]|uniref:Gamma-glutamyltranspeptidase / glutathione hydrolase n=1 Tax=Pseudonocardia thermophila TaxID=1848 RepID=A0A1M6U6U0_PSETH|nr:gamma-glutamyltranspeptidase / glutathione hydrolase [Pseudonocardia thermophila]
MPGVGARSCVASGTIGAVAAGVEAAAAVGAAVLRDGGNAFDAAVATALAETVALPPKCGLAGDVVALVVTPEHPQPRSVVALGGAAAGLHDAAAAAGWRVAPTGPLSVGVPGAPAGYAALAARGRLPLERLTAPAIDLARSGMRWSPMNAVLEAESRDLLATYQPGGCRYSPRSRPHEVGDTVALPGLARVLEEFTERGAALFHDGPVAGALLRTVEGHGGVLTAADLCSVAVDERAAPASAIADTPESLWVTHLPTYGAALADVLARTAPAAISPQAVAASLAALLRGDLGADEGTSTVAAADAEGNAVVLVHSNSFPQYGSGIVVEDYDLVLSNRAGRGFTFAPGHPNAPVPGRRPLTTLHAWALRHPTGWLLGATPGGRQQVAWNAQLLGRLLCGPPDLPEDRLTDALTSARWLLDADGTVRAEGRDLPELGARCTHTLVRTAPDGITAAADPRWDATAVAV